MKAKAVEPTAQTQDLDVQTIMARIRASLIEQAPDSDVEYPTFAAACARSGAATPSFTEEMYYQLEQANLNRDQVWTELSLVESQMPLLGPFVNRFKRELHQLVIYYVNMLGRRQVTVNDALVRALNQLVDALEHRPEQPAQEPSAEANRAIQALQREIAELRARVESLEHKSGE